MGGDVQGEMQRTSSTNRPIKMDVHNYNVGPKDKEQECRKTSDQMIGRLQDD